MKKALIVYGGWEGHDPKGVAEVFEDILTKENFSVENSDSLDAFLTDLSVYDLIIPVWTMGTLSWEMSKNVLSAVESGVGLAGCHGGMCDAFRDNTDWQFMTGAQWVAHPDNIINYKVNITDKTHPLTKGINDFSVASEQYYIHVDPAVKVYATTVFKSDSAPYAANGEITVPVVYTKFWGKGKIYYNSLGHDRFIFDIPEVRELMRRGFLYAAR
ncbi:MAG: ThuA domain-containing protein [Clostridia bacterium]|nr:ThuA domain-containing protein [Clostridia bacterium]